jgi:hypothetical protein
MSSNVNSLQPFTHEYWIWEVQNMRKMWGTKSFWKDPDAALSAFGALTVVYIRTPDLTERDEITMMALKNEFDMRLHYALQLDLTT